MYLNVLNWFWAKTTFKHYLKKTTTTKTVFIHCYVYFDQEDKSNSWCWYLGKRRLGSIRYCNACWWLFCVYCYKNIHFILYWYVFWPAETNGNLCDISIVYDRHWQKKKFDKKGCQINKHPRGQTTHDGISRLVHTDIRLWSCVFSSFFHWIARTVVRESVTKPPLTGRHKAA